MDIRTLKYFLAVAQEENITKAAERLFISQPALSRQLQSLEDELGCQLFVRGKRSVTLTEEGFLLRHRAQEIVELTEKTERDFKNANKTLGGVIGIGSGELEAAHEALPRLIGKFTAVYPEVKFDIYSNNTDHIKERMEKGLLDFGIFVEPTELSRYNYVRLPVTDKWGIVVSTQDELSKQPYVTVDQLVGKKLFGSHRPAINSMLSSWFGEHQELGDYAITNNLIYNTALLVEHNMGIIVCVGGAASLYHNTNFVFVPLYPEVSCTCVLAWRKNLPTSPAVAKFIELIYSEYGAAANNDN